MGFSLSKLANWTAKTAGAIATGNPAAIVAQVADAVPGGRLPTSRTGPTSPPAPGSTGAPGGSFWVKFRNFMTTPAAIIGGVVLVVGLGAVLVFRRRK